MTSIILCKSSTLSNQTASDSPFCLGPAADSSENSESPVEAESQMDTAPATPGPLNLTLDLHPNHSDNLAGPFLRVR